MVEERYTRAIITAFRRALDDLRTTRIGGSATTALWSDLRDLATGKLIRPRLFLYVLERGGIVPEGEHFRIAAGIELLHQFACIHDDIVDRCDMRRGIPSLHGMLEQRHRGIGTDAALIAADALYSHGLRCICEASCIRRHPTVLSRILEYATLTSVGQYEELCGAALANVTAVQNLYALKTACYTVAAPVVAGAELTGIPPPERRKLEAAAITAGIAYQLWNDCKDIDRRTREDGTGEFNDFRMRKKNVPYLMLERSVNRDERELLREALHRGDVATYERLLEQYGIRAEIEAEIDRHLTALPEWLRAFFGWEDSGLATSDHQAAGLEKKR